MKEVMLLTKILFKSSLNKASKNEKKTGKIILYLLAYGFIIGFVSYMGYTCISSLMLIEQENLFIQMMFSAMIWLGIIQTIISSLNLLFFSKDIETILPLPINPIKIVMAKFNCLIISQYVLSAICLMPILIVYGILLKCSMVFYFISLLVLLIFPILPVCISAFLVTVIMKFTKLFRNKEIVQYLSVFVTIVLVIGIQFFSGANADNDQISNEELANMIVSKSSVVNSVSNFFITVQPALNTIVNYNNLDGVTNLIILFGESIVVYFAICFITSKIYIKTVMSINSIGKKNKKRVNSFEKISENKIWKTYTKKEFINLIRNPIFLMQCVLPSILFPLIFAIPIVVSFKNSGESIEDMRNFFGESIVSAEGFGVSLIIICMLYMFNFIAITAISRDGNDALFMKYIPIPLEKQIFYKILPGIILNIVPTLYIIVFEKIMFTQVDFKYIFILFITSQIINIFNNYVMVLIDLKNPKLNWTTEYAVVKQNFNMIFQFLIIIAEGILIVLSFGKLSMEMAQITLVFLFALALIIVRRYVKNNKNKIFAKIN